jgi:hypothetical protein
MISSKDTNVKQQTLDTQLRALRPPRALHTRPAGTPRYARPRCHRQPATRLGKARRRRRRTRMALGRKCRTATA